MASKPHSGPTRIRFHGHDVEFSEGVRFLVADEATNSIMDSPHWRDENDPEAPEWQQMMDQALDLFASAGQEDEGYEWLVTPNPELDDRLPAELIRGGEGLAVIRQIELHLNHRPGR